MKKRRKRKLKTKVEWKGRKEKSGRAKQEEPIVYWKGGKERRKKAKSAYSRIHKIVEMNEVK